MTITDSLLKEIELGREGHNEGFSMGLPKLESIIDGVTKQTYTTVFSNSGAGKTNFVLYSYVFTPLMEHLEDDRFKVFYCSLEMNSSIIFGKLLSMYIFSKYGIELSIKELLSRKRGYRLSDKNYKIVQSCKDWLNKIESKIIIYDKSLNAKVLYKLLMDDLQKMGRFEETEKRKIYYPNNPDLIYVVVVDHISLLRPQPGNSLKQEIDDTSAYLLTLRNMCGISPVVVQQANREQGNMERRKQGVNNFTINDTKDSGGPVQDSEIVISIYNPNRDKLSSYRGYDVKKLGNVFRVISVLKSRYGEADVEIGVNFFGRSNWWAELPIPSEIYDYDKYLTPDYLIKKDEDDIKKEDEKCKNDFKLIL